MRVHNLGRGILGVLSGLLLAGGGLVHSSRASADFEWCWDDPVVAINGQQLQTLIGAQGSAIAIAHGGFRKATVVYTVPKGVSTSVLTVTNPFFREQVVFRVSNRIWTPGTPIPVTVSVSFNGVGVFNTDMRNLKHGALLSDVTGTTVTGLTASFSLQ